ncbi:lea domain protein [Botrytis cinerea]
MNTVEKDLISQPHHLGDRLTIQKPLSRRGRGPGLLILTPESYTSRTDRKTLDPEPIQKWAEESFVVVNVTIPEHALKAGEADLQACLESGIKALKSSPECTDSDKLGLIFAIFFTNDTKQLTEKLTHKSVSPLMVHSSAALQGPQLRSEDISHVYATTKSTNFILPSHNHYDPGSAGVAHTRSLGFIKKHLGGPVFDLEAIWDEHTLYEFGERNVKKTMGTMVDQPYVNHIPTMTGGIGRGPLTDFYTNHFVFNNPEDTKLELVSRTVGVDRVIDEFVFSFTHDRVIDWILPGVPPTHKYARIPFTSVVNVRGDRLYHEHIAWDQATALRQLGLLPEYLPFPYPLPDGRLPAKGKRFEYRVPTAGVETAQKLVDESSVASNGLLGFDIREVDDV